jgi:membrane-associated phospholipid phosphatase
MTVVASPNHFRDEVRRLLSEVAALDRGVAHAVFETPTPVLDPIIRRLSRASDHKGLWLATSAAMIALDGRRGRQAALRCLASVGVTSVVADYLTKLVFTRARPPASSVPQDRVAHRPTSSSFPSGHTASAFAFATAFGREYPLLQLPITALATAVGYSRVHTGVHYPSDVLAGAVIGSGTAALTGALLDRVCRLGEPHPG